MNELSNIESSWAGHDERSLAAHTAQTNRDAVQLGQPIFLEHIIHGAVEDRAVAHQHDRRGEIEDKREADA